MLPSSFKKQLNPAAQDRFVVRKDIFEKCLTLIPWDEWDSQIKVLRSKINPFNREQSQFLRDFYKNTAELVLDNTNRLLLPKHLMEMSSISKEVMLLGIDSKIEIWSKSLYQGGIGNEDDFAARAEKFLGGSFNSLNPSID